MYPGPLTNGDAFTVVTLDARRFFEVMPGLTVALRAWGESSGGDVPFDVLPALGGDALLRGYYEGRFRDHHLLVLEGGLRFPIAWRIRGAAFGGVGQVVDEFGSLGADRFKASVGGGLRVVLDRDEGVLIRVDYAYAVDVRSGGLYFGLGEAF